MSTGQVYAGTLVSGELVINIEGDVDREVCDFAFEGLTEFLNRGDGQVTFDCSKVRNLCRTGGLKIKFARAIFRQNNSIASIFKALVSKSHSRPSWSKSENDWKQAIFN